VYTAPDDVPSTPTVTVVVSANSDPSRFATAALTVVQGGPITFNHISPTAFAQGAFQQDIYLGAPNVSSISSIVVKRPDGTTDTLAEARFKTIFPVPNSTPASQTSIGARVRLSAADLKLPGTYQLCIEDEAWPVTPPDCPMTFPSFASFFATAVRPSITGTIPVTVTEKDPSTTLTVNGGYFGADGSSLVTIAFEGANSTSGSSNLSARQLSVTAQNISSFPGLYQLSVAGVNRAAVSNVSVFPDYGAGAGTDQPMIVATTAAGSVPSAIAIDTLLGIAVVAQAGANTVQFYTIGTGTLTPLGAAIAVGHTPTGVSINEATHQAVVVNYGDKSLSVLQIPSGTVVRTIGLGLGGAISASPYSVGVDPDANRAMVALSNTNLGLIVNLNTSGSDTCIDSSQTLPCATASVTLGTGQYPQIAVEPGTHRAWVTPGGVTPGSGGPLSVVDLRQTNGTVAITSATRASNVITVTTSAQHSLDPGNPGVVLITGMSDASFNGSFAVLSVVDAFHFTYSSVGTAATATGGMVRFGKPNLAFNLSTSARGIALNLLTRTAATADPIASGSARAQINLINSLDQSISTISLAPNCFGSNSCNGPETDTTHVAFQPYSNVLVSFNPVHNEVSFLNPDPGTSTVGRQFVKPTGQTGVGSAGGLTISGAVAVDPATNQALVVNSGSGNITLVQLSARKKNVQITRLQIPGGLLPQATLTSSQPLNGVRIFGSDFTAPAQVELDGTAIPATVVSSREIDVNIPATDFLSLPRRFALDVRSGNTRSNATDFMVLKAVDFSAGCDSPSPAGVVIDDARDIAVVTDSGCNTVSIVDVNPDHTATYGTIIGTVGVGAAPTGVAVVPRHGFAVVTNNGAGTASVLDLSNPANPKQAVPDVTVGTSPNGVAINPENGEVIIANTGSNTISEIDLTPLMSSDPASSLTATNVPVDQQPIAVAIDPDRGSSGRGLAVVTAQQIGVSGATAALDVLDLGTSTPTRSTSGGTSLLPDTPTGIAFDATSGLFYVTSSSANAIISFNPDTSRTSGTAVGINPTAVAFNPQTGAILTVNSASNTISIVDTLSSPFRTRATLGISGSGQYGAAIHARTNMGFIADPANKRVLLFPMP
jgi:DNA-binding beta-propeller fold protein YncE